LKVINKVDVTKAEINLLFKDGAYFIMFHFFMEYYFYEAYLKTAELFNSLRADIIKDIKSKYIILLVLYLIVSILLFLLIIIFTYSIRKHFNSFLYFIAIFPLKFLAEDENLFKQTLRLNDNMFR
jgi:hypothetical protein